MSTKYIKHDGLNIICIIGIDNELQDVIIEHLFYNLIYYCSRYLVINVLVLNVYINLY